jgi:hypothetical protein
MSWVVVTYINPAEGTVIKMIRKVSRAEIEEFKGNFELRNPIQERTEQSAKIIE